MRVASVLLSFNFPLKQNGQSVRASGGREKNEREGIEGREAET